MKDEYTFSGEEMWIIFRTWYIQKLDLMRIYA